MSAAVLTIAEAAYLLGLSRKTVLRLIREGRIEPAGVSYEAIVRFAADADARPAGRRVRCS
ncbi:MAG: helix-turn-helix domain-containing protein [Verrucomicrobia bacterium]|nr:helix-turn-helix domain-containing protein [Verrucomicrobiota bacterium]